MKEERYFYVPDAMVQGELPDEEAAHALRVLRLKEGDAMVLIDGQGTFYHAVVTQATGHRCSYSITQSVPQPPAWQGHLHLAIAPTKMMDRMEWLAEKATEVGFDELSLLDCRFSERRVVKTERLERIVVSAMKQSRKACKPIVNPMLPFRHFMDNHPQGARYIAHCYDEIARVPLFDALRRQTDHSALVMIGPEGDFSVDEVRQAVDAGFVSVTLGDSRLRTETAGLAAVMMMQLSQL